MRVLVGADVGGTKLAVRVETLDGVVRADTHHPAAGWEASPVRDAARWLAEHLARAVPEGDEIAAFGIGAQGCDSQEHCARLAAAVEELGTPAAVVNDAALLIPAAGLDTGIGIIAGTGSIGVGADADGAVLFSGGWGWVLGDGGSAPAIVREATKAALTAYDEGLPDDGLLAALLEHFGAGGPQSLARKVNDDSTTGNWGPGAPAIFRAADAGSALAAAVVDEAADQLALLVARLVAQGAAGDTVVAAGSVIVGQPRLAEGLRERLARTHPALTLRLLDEEPVAGGVVLARRRYEAG
ncbi:N-acetylglucosamine kinase [Streptomyces sp. 8L]|uniref:N-acetylglucosamine kinase n=1 Tax=Streptomyces sp. 8L TaxID=2877242 RepID=UPI001CD564B5|nr:BadF/BadG/BcrA/BcrD ATPase family protein [Streptomyces sp. 8L]MCA1222474.1 ATPase [Streptomyces sp. 8L]